MEAFEKFSPKEQIVPGVATGAGLLKTIVESVQQFVTQYETRIVQERPTVYSGSLVHLSESLFLQFHCDYGRVVIQELVEQIPEESEILDDAQSFRDYSTIVEFLDRERIGLGYEIQCSRIVRNRRQQVFVRVYPHDCLCGLVAPFEPFEKTFEQKSDFICQYLGSWRSFGQVGYRNVL